MDKHMNMESEQSQNVFESYNRLKASVSKSLDSPEEFERIFRVVLSEISSEEFRSYIDTEFSLRMIELAENRKFTKEDWGKLPGELKDRFSELKKEVHEKIKNEKGQDGAQLPEEPDEIRDFYGNNRILSPGEIDYEKMPTEKLRKIHETIIHVLKHGLYDKDELDGIYEKKGSIERILLNRKKSNG